MVFACFTHVQATIECFVCRLCVSVANRLILLRLSNPLESHFALTFHFYRPFVFRPPIKDLAMELASDPGHIPSVGCLAGLDWFETILAADVEVSATSTPLDLFSDPGVVSAKEAGRGTVLEKSREMTPARIAALIYPK